MYAVFSSVSINPTQSLIKRHAGFMDFDFNDPIFYSLSPDIYQNVKNCKCPRKSLSIFFTSNKIF